MRLIPMAALGCAILGITQASQLIERDNGKSNQDRTQLPNYYKEPCERYKFDPKNGFNWNYEGTLNYDDRNPNHLYRGDWKRVKIRHNHGKRISRGYMYTFKAGTGLFKGTNMWISIIRDDIWHQGLGAQFRIDFRNSKKVVLDSFWARPNENCSVESLRPASDFGNDGEIAIWARIYDD